MARAQGARALMALAFETTYGTPPVSGFTRMPFASTSLGAEQPLLNSELLGYGRDPRAPIKDAVTADGDVVVPLDAVLTASRVAPLTRRIGLIPTATVTHTEPFHVSKAIATLDFVSGGRAGVAGGSRRMGAHGPPRRSAHLPL